MDKRKRVQEFRPDMTAKLEKALSHPLRATILARLNDGPAGASEIAREIEEPRNNINYHIGVLLKYECIELVEEKQIRGVVAKIYRGTTKVLLDYEAWEGLSPKTRMGISIKALGQALELAQHALATGYFEKRIDRVVANHRPELDEQAWKKCVNILRRASAEIEEVVEEVALRNPPAPTLQRFAFSLLGYEAPPPGHTK